MEQQEQRDKSQVLHSGQEELRRNIKRMCSLRSTGYGSENIAAT
jgi:hypothetical protein